MDSAPHSPKLEPLTSNGKLSVFKSSRKVHPSFPRSESCGGLQAEEWGQIAGPEDSQKSRLNQASREISGSVDSVCEYFQALNELEKAAATPFHWTFTTLHALIGSKKWSGPRSVEKKRQLGCSMVLILQLKEVRARPGDPKGGSRLGCPRNLPSSFYSPLDGDGGNHASKG